MKNFALIGLAGFIAPRHLDAIKKNGGSLVAALDPHDSVGIIDSYFPEAQFFTEFERFDRHIEMLKQDKDKKKVDYISICSPNYFHDAHIRLALRTGANAICEKPLVLNPWNIDRLGTIQKETGKKVYTILQLRHHDTILKLKEKVTENPHKIYDIDLMYITSRGSWYDYSWKNDIKKSGGIATNIGIHFFDMLTWIFGGVQKNVTHVSTERKASGYLELDNARVRWFLSIDCDDLPQEAKDNQMRTFRSIKIDNDEMEFSAGFTDLHVKSYSEILNGNGYGLEDAKTAVEIAHTIRESKPIGLTGEFHPYLKSITI